MQGTSSLPATSHTNAFANALHHVQTLSVPKRISFAMAGAFLFTGAAAWFGYETAGQQDSAVLRSYQTQQSNVSVPPASPADASSSTSSVHANVSTNSSSNSDTTPQVTTNVTVNGQNIAVPANGSSQQTVTNSDGSQTTVDVQSNHTTQGDATNNSSTNFSLHVVSNSTSSGGTTSR